MLASSAPARSDHAQDERELTVGGFLRAWLSLPD
jgi:hypothetical protein